MKLETLMPDIYKLIPYDYQQIKTNVYEDILTQSTQTSAASEKPKLIQVSGIPGSGKSTYCQSFLQQNPHFTYISFDKIMESLPSYQYDIIHSSSATAFQKWEMPAKIIGYELLRRLVENKSNILLEHSGVNSAHIQLVQNIKAYGYKTHLHVIMCPEEIAVTRVQKREEITKRHTPPALIKERASLMQDYVSRYRQLVDTFEIYHVE